MGMLQEFKTFAMKGSVVDLAIGVIIGAAFGKVVAALVEQILMPPLGLVIGGVDFSQLKLVIKHASGMEPEVAIGYGIFVQAIVNFMIIAWALFLVIKAVNRVHVPKPSAATPEDILLLREIRDSLKK